MPNGPHNVTLTVDSSNNFQFTGGSDGRGKCENRVGQGAAPVQITLSAPNGYQITSVGLVDEEGSGSSQMRTQVTGQGQSAVITNPCTANANVEYTVNVQTSGGTTIPCHPKIVNT